MSSSSPAKRRSRGKGAALLTSRNKRNLTLAAKWACYFLLLLVAATLQTTPGFLTIGQVRPIFILPLCLAVAMVEGEYPGAFFGAVGGLLWDFTAGRPGGLLALELLFICFGAAILVELYLRLNAMNFVLVSGLCALVVTGVDFLFFYAMPGYEGAAARYFELVLPMVVFTAALSPVSLWAAGRVYRRFPPAE